MRTYNRNILKYLNIWSTKKDRKPLIIRGARQTGKTVAVNLFAQKFENFVPLNLERISDKRLFESDDLENVIRAVEFAKGKSLKKPRTLLFIDEIQNSEKAIKFLRFFYEDYPDLFVIAAGSLLEAAMLREGFSFPVGRVEFLYLYPVTFDEFLLASGNENIHDGICRISPERPAPEILHALASEQFKQYSMLGGMPAAVAKFIETGSLKEASDIKEDLILAIEDDVAKYSNTADAKYVRHVIEYSPQYVGSRIKYEKFGQSAYHSREMKRAFDVLEYAMVVQRAYGSTSVKLPICPNFRVAPKIIYLDAGLVAHKVGLAEEIIHSTDLNSIFRGCFAEQLAGQAFLANVHRKLTPCFWYRGVTSEAEIDFIFQHNGKAYPIEIKSGKKGSLKSLLQFMRLSPLETAIRVYSGCLSVDNVIAGNKTCKLLSIPFYLMWRLGELLDKKN